MRDCRGAPLDFAASRHGIWMVILIEAKDLINGASIVSRKGSTRVDYFHLELDSHDVISPKARCRKPSSTTTAAACSTTRINMPISILKTRAPCTLLRTASRQAQ